MKTHIYKIVIVLFIILNASISYSQENASEGTRFLIAFPQNERTSNSSRDDFNTNVKLAIYISSSTDATITLENHSNSKVLTRTIKKDEVLTLDNFELGKQSEIEETSDGLISNKVIEILSDKPISVFVINSKNNTSDGYLAYPVSEWGNNYIHNSFYHLYRNRESRSSGFTILSQKDSTLIKVILKGRGFDKGSTKTGNLELGDTIYINLNKNESYSVKTKSNFNNTFDLSGTLIIGNNPIGLLSFHERTLIPQDDPDNGYDHLIEMMQPLSNWRNKFISVDFGREMGDFFRVLPLNDNTNLTITNYNESGVLNKTETININTGGGFYEFNNAKINSYNSQNLVGIKGSTIWESDQPILVTQYAYSQDWEKIRSNTRFDNYDPFMLNLINEEQFTNNIRFLVPSYNDFDKHNINMIVNIDPNLDINNQLESIEYDGTPIYIIYPELKNNRIGNTNYYWLRFQVNSGVHSINSEVRLAAFLYGFGSADSYGMQTALGNLPLKDTLVSRTNSFDCDSFNLDYKIKSTFGADGSQGYYSKDYKFSDFKVITADGIEYDYSISADSLVINFTGYLTNKPFESKYIIEAISETGKVFYDTVYYRFNKSIPLNNPKVSKITPGDEIYFTVSLNEAKDTLAFLNNYTISFKFYREWFELLDFEILGESVITQLTDTTINDTIYYQLNYDLPRSHITSGNSVVILLRSLLNKDSLFTPEFALFSKEGNDCYYGSKSDTVNVDICVHGLRVIEMNWDEDLVINKSVLSSNSKTVISIYNYEGREIISNYILNDGQEVDLNTLLKNKGLYFIKNTRIENSIPLKYFHF
ncbi:MAG: IgGFc-binding protein [Candidatus Kapaibacterium sp.]